MKKLLNTLVILTLTLSFVAFTQNKFIGVKACAPCHKGEKKGSMFEIWEKSAHSGAFKTLESEEAQKIAKEKGLKTAAHESKECLTCHVAAAGVDAKLLDKGYDKKEGISCEACHSAGSGYKTMAIMKDKKKSIEAGMTEYVDEKAIEAQCVTCHNEKSPTYKEFKFKDAWAKIAHPAPKK